MGGWEGGQGAPRGWGVRRCQPKIGSQSGDDVSNERHAWARSLESLF